MPINYSFDRRKTGSAHTGGCRKLTWAHVNDIRKWASLEGFGLSKAEQIRQLRGSFLGVGLSECTLRQVLCNESWFDANYTPGAPHESLGQLTVAQLVLRTLRRTA